MTYGLAYFAVGFCLAKLHKRMERRRGGFSRLDLSEEEDMAATAAALVIAWPVVAPWLLFWRLMNLL